MNSIIFGALKKSQMRRSSDSCWPLVNAEGKTWAQVKLESEDATSKRKSNS